MDDDADWVMGQPELGRRPDEQATVESMSTNNRTCRKSFDVSSTSTQEPHSLPIYEHGSALIRRHEKEVTAVTWNYDGSLQLHDFTVRCWREDGDKAG